MNVTRKLPKVSLFNDCSHISEPICAASNSHSPNRCKMLLHLGRDGANDGLFSFEIDRIDVKLLADGGPELGPITVLILVERLLVKLIKEPFESPASSWEDKEF